jgi:hypothetical protein
MTGAGDSQLMNAEIDSIRARHAARQAGQPLPPDTPSQDQDLTTLLDSVQEQADELARLGLMAEDLRASSELWARLYEANVLRANAREGERTYLVDCASADASERIAVLTGALEALVGTCEECGRGRLPQPDEGLCGRCELAMDALRACHKR